MCLHVGRSLACARSLPCGDGSSCRHPHTAPTADALPLRPLMAPTRPLATPLRASAPSWGLPPPHPRYKPVTFHQVRNNQHSAALAHGSSLRSCALLCSLPLRGSLLIGEVAPWRHSVGWRCPSPGRCPQKVASSRWSDAFGVGLRSPLTFRGQLPFACPRHSPTCPHSAPKEVFGRASPHQDY